MRINLLLAVSLLASTLVACVAETDESTESDLSKDEIKANPKADWGFDFCEKFGWYEDGECDTFCPDVDPECPVQFCDTARCGPYKVCSEILDACITPPPPFCPTADCDYNEVCDEDRRECVVPEEEFCPTAFCGPDTTCNELLNYCAPN